MNEFASLDSQDEMSRLAQVTTEEINDDFGDNATPCPECSATGQHYMICSQRED